MKRMLVTGTVLAMVACGKGQRAAPPSTASDEPKSEAPAEQPEETKGDAIVQALPTSVTCFEGAECLPRPSFTQATCKGRFLGMAIKMFEEGSPWTRLYVTGGRLEPMNTHGGKTTTPLEPNEEVLLLRRQSDGGDGMSVSGTDVDILRWDGSCATLPAELLAGEDPGVKKSARISFRFLDETMREALLNNEAIKSARSEEKELCRSAPDSADCTKASQRVSDAVVTAVRGGMTLPEPDLLPEWNIQE